MKLCYYRIIWWNIEFKIVVLGDESVNMRMLIDVLIENLWSIFVLTICDESGYLCDENLCEFEWF